MRACTIDDLLGLESLSDPQCSSDGTRVAVVVTRADRDQDRSRTTVDVVDLVSGDRTALTRGPSDRAPRWSPCGRWLAFLRADDGPEQVWLLPVAGGEPHRLTDLPLGVSELAWSPDGARLAVTAPELPEGAQPHDPVVVTRLVSKADGSGRLGSLTVHAHVVDVGTGSTTRLTEGDLVVRELAWSPDGRNVALVTARHKRRDLDAVTHVFVVAATGDQLRQVTAWEGSATSAVWALDGRSLLLVGRSEPLVSGHSSLFRVDIDGGVPQRIAAELDRNVMVGGPGYPGTRPQPTADGGVRFCIRDRGAVHLMEVDATGTLTTLVGGEVTVSGASAEPLVVLLSDGRSTADLHVVEPTGLRRVTTTNADFFADVEIAVPQSRRFTAPDGMAVDGWVTGARGDAPQPLLLDVHGGPHNAWGPSFDPVHAYSQVLAGQGWAVLTLNIRGSDGYGEKHWTAARGAWGVADADDLLSAVDELVEEGVADPARLAVTGYSYGGYMTCWLSTRTGRFAAAVPGGVVVDLVSFSGTADVAGLLDPMEFGVSPATGGELLRELSPLTRVCDVRTPTLILHGADDDRCPVGQAEQWFTALRTQGTEVEMVLYPGGSHLFVLSGRPSHRADYNGRVVDWVTSRTS